MNWERIAGNWKQMRGTLKEQFGKLTEDDLTAAAGKREAFIGRLQERYGIAKEEAEKRLNEFLERMHEPAARH